MGHFVANKAERPASNRKKGGYDIMRKTSIFNSIFVLALLSSSVCIFAQSGRVTQRPDAQTDDTDKVFVEEIKLNVSALNPQGKLYEGVTANDLVIQEDGILHVPASVRRLPANIIILLDTGGEERQAKDFKTTIETAKALIAELRKDDEIALIEVNDEARVVTEWTNDREQLMHALEKQVKFGIRSRFVDGLKLALDTFSKARVENKHLVLITDGLESVEGVAAREAIMSKMLETDINVHVVSYTKMERAVIQQRGRSVSAGNPKIPVPPGGGVPVQGTTSTVRMGTVNLDRAMIRKIKARGIELQVSEKALTKLADNTNGEMILPDSREEMVAKMEYLSRIIDSNYVVTYVPKRALSEAKVGEERTIDVTSRRYDLLVQGKRKLIVPTQSRQ